MSEQSSCSSCDTVTTDTSVESTCYATIAQDQSDGCLPSSSDLSHPSEETCSNSSISVTTGGGDASSLTDQKETSAMTLVGRIGDRLSKFVGSGFIQVKDGEASLVSQIKLKVSELWHKYVIPNPGGAAVIGAAKPAPYLLISDNNGKVYAIKGLTGENSIVVWDHDTQAWETKATTDFPVAVKGVLPKADGIELSGFRPPSEACYEKAREAVALKGDGIVFVTSTEATYPDSVCCDEDCNGAEDCCDYNTHAIASVVPYPSSPTADTTYFLGEDG